MRVPTGVICIALFAFDYGLTSAAEPALFSVEKQSDRVVISRQGRPLATYVFRDDTIPRPYFRDVHSPRGIQVTRRHPPVKGMDLDDHPTFHPGIWQAFGDLGGSDFWRNKGRVRQVRFAEEPMAKEQSAAFAVENAYENGDTLIGTEFCRFSILDRPGGTLLLWDSTFRPAAGELVFGDQEEMGLGVRVATPLAVVKGGAIRNSDGLINERNAWGKQADWCEYSGTIDGTRCGLVIMPDPSNFRRSWFHARDYGVLVANPFGRKAFTKGEASRISVKRDDPLHLQYGILIFDNAPDKPADIPAAYRDFLRQIGR